MLAGTGRILPCKRENPLPTRCGTNTVAAVKRRDFLSSSLAAAATLPAMFSTAAEAPAVAREYYELRRYHLRFGPMQKRFDDFFRDVAIPAMNRAGVRAVGVFGVLAGPDSPSMHVLLPHASAESLLTLEDRLMADAAYRKGGETFLAAPAADPSYVRLDSSVFVAFAGMPKLEVPAAAAEKKARIFEMRIYESPSKEGNIRKVGMFNDGEIAIFRKTGLHPVFFGEAIAGANLPNLTYLLTFADMEEREKNWAVFRNDPDWKKLSATPGLGNAEILTTITNLFLRPTAYSQI